MQCIWTPTTSVLRRPIGRASHALVTCRRQSIQSRRFTQLFRKAESQCTAWADADKRRTLSSVSQAFVSAVIRDTSVSPTPFMITGGSSKEQDVNNEETEIVPVSTPAKLSRAAAQSVRLACQQSSIHEALLIVKSVKASVAHYGKDWYPGKPFREKVAIDFGMTVSPRLAIHSLLHGLLRQGMTKKVGDIAKQVILHCPEIRLSDRTLQVITTALCQTDVRALKDEAFRAQLQKAKSQFGDYLRSPKEVMDKKVQLPCTRSAVKLFYAAKQYRKQRAKQMFQQLIDACLLQGEILVVSFLFALLLKQWEGGLSSSSLEGDRETLARTGNGNNSNSTGLRLRKSFLDQTLAYITPILSNVSATRPQAIKPCREEAAQALASLAGMLHENLLPYPQIDELVKALLLFNPSTSIIVWTRRKGKKDKWERRDAREYFDEVLDHLLAQVKNERRIFPRNKLASLDTFNNLLIYALRRKVSPTLAHGMIERMTRIGGNRTPNITTFNILLRASTAFRRQDITSKILETLRSKPENNEHGIMYEPRERQGRTGGSNCTKDGEKAVPAQYQPATCRPVSPEHADRNMHTSMFVPVVSSPVVPDAILAQLSPAVRRILLEDIDLDDLLALESPLPADGDTLAAYIDFLTASGHPSVASRLVLILLPELRVASYPRIHPEAQRLGNRKWQFNKRIAVARAIGLGPIFFTSALNALVKAGMTGLAERTWRLAKSAESCSWNPEFKSRPWIMPCAAYTVMMQCYGMEARKAFRLSYNPQLAVTRTQSSERQIKGWGITSVVRRIKGKRSLSLLEVSRDMGAWIFRSRQISEEAYQARLVAYLKEGGVVQDQRILCPPVADERFFNAALDLFSRLPWSYIIRMKSKASPSAWRRLERRQLNYLMRRGCARFPQDSRLLSVLCAMRKAGYEIPIAFKHMLVGVTVPSPMRLPSRHWRPHAYYYRRPGTVRSRRLPTAKERGLPVRKVLKVVRKQESICLA